MDWVTAGIALFIVGVTLAGLGIGLYAFYKWLRERQ